MAFRKDIDTTYADLRPTDKVIDKSGQAWPIANLETSPVSGSEIWQKTFWLCDPVSKVKMHWMQKFYTDAVKVSRLPTQADEAAKLEADFPKSSAPANGEGSEAEVSIRLPESVQAEINNHLDESAKLSAGIAKVIESDMAESVAAVEEIGGTVEAEVTAAEVDAAAAATDDAPVSLPPFADMTPLEQRSHLYLLHGLYGSDVTGKTELAAVHEQAHAQHDAGTLNSRHVPHTHIVTTEW